MFLQIRYILQLYLIFKVKYFTVQEFELLEFYHTTYV